MAATAEYEYEQIIPAPEPMGYPFGPDDPYAAGHDLLDSYLEGPFLVEHWWDAISPRDSAAGQAMLTAAPELQVTVAHAALDRLAWLARYEWRSWHGRRSHRQALEGLVRVLFARQLPFGRDDLAHILRVVVSTDDLRWQPWRGVLNALERYLAAHELPDELRPWLERQRDVLDGHYLRAAYRPLVLRIEEILGESEPGLPEVGEPWAELLLARLAALDEPVYDDWRALLASIPMTNGVKPSRAWLAAARDRLQAVGEGAFLDVAREVFAAAARDIPTVVSGRNAMVLKGLVWYASLCDSAAVVSAAGALAAAMFTPVPGEGPRSTKVGSACLYLLSERPGAAPALCLARLYRRVASRAVREDIYKALARAALRADVSWADVKKIAPEVSIGDEWARLS